MSSCCDTQQELRAESAVACVKTIVTCPCGARSSWSVRTVGSVPPALRCSPELDRWGPGSAVRCARCARPTGWTVGGLARAVEDALSDDPARWLVIGAVVLEA